MRRSIFFLAPCCERQISFTVHLPTFWCKIKRGNYARAADESFSLVPFGNKFGGMKKIASAPGIISLLTTFSLRFYWRVDVPDEVHSIIGHSRLIAILKEELKI